MYNSSSSNNGSHFNYRYHQTFSSGQSNQSTRPTEYSLEDEYHSNDFPLIDPSVSDQNELQGFGVGVQGSTPYLYQTPPPPTPQLNVDHDPRAAYADIRRSHPSSSVYDPPRTFNPPTNGQVYGFTNIQTGRPTASGSAHGLNQRQYHESYYPPTNQNVGPPSTSFATYANTTSSLSAPLQGIAQHQQWRTHSTATSQTTSSSPRREAPVAISRQDAVPPPQRPRPELRYPCSECDRIFHDPSELVRHLGEKHGIADSHWRCDDCEARGTPFERVRKHRVKEHCRDVHGQLQGHERCHEADGPPSTEPRRRTRRTQRSGRRR